MLVGLFVALACAPSPPAPTAAYFPSGGSVGLPYAAKVLRAAHQPPLSPGPDRLRLLVMDAWFREGTLYVVTPAGDSALLTRVTLHHGKPSRRELSSVSPARWASTRSYLDTLGLLAATIPDGSPADLDGTYRLWEIELGGRYARGEFGEGTDPIAQAEHWMDYLAEGAR